MDSNTNNAQNRSRASTSAPLKIDVLSSPSSLTSTNTTAAGPGTTGGGSSSSNSQSASIALSMGISGSSSNGGGVGGLSPISLTSHKMISGDNYQTNKQGNNIKGINNINNHSSNSNISKFSNNSNLSDLKDDDIDVYIHGKSHLEPKTNTIQAFYDTFWDEKGPSEWSQMINDVDKRPNGWIKRYSHRLTEEDILKRKETYWDRKKTIHDKFRESPLRLGNTPERADEPVCMPSRVPIYDAIGGGADTCFVCNRFVSIGPYRFGCKNCNNICHLECIVKSSSPLPSSPSKIIEKLRNEKFADDAVKMVSTCKTEFQSTPGKKTKAMKAEFKIEVANKLESINTRKSKETALHNNEQLETIDKMKLARDLTYASGKNHLLTCYFCKSEMQNYNKYYESKYAKSLGGHIRVKAVLKIQSWARMIVERCNFIILRKGVTVLQRIIRAIQFGKRLESERKHSLRPFRLRVHQILAFVPRVLEEEAIIGLATKKETPPVLFPHMHSPTYHKLGDMKSSLYDRYFGTDQLYLQTELDMSMYKILKPGHQSKPVYLQTIAARQPFQRGQLFATISIHVGDGGVEIAQKEIDDGVDENAYDAYARKAGQIYRIDTPLKDVGPANMKAADYYRINNMKLPPSPAALDLIDKSFVVKRFVLSNPYVLLPACKSDIQVRISLSEVTDWPKAVMLGHARMKNVSDFILWKQSASIFQTFENSHWYDTPDRHDGIYLNIVYRSNVNITCGYEFQKKSDDDGTVVKKPSYGCDGSSSSSSSSSSNSNDLSNSKRDKFRSQIFEPAITWSFLSYTDDLNNQAGLAYIYQEESLASSRKKSWMVLIDSRLMLYSPSSKQAGFSTEVDIVSSTVAIGSFGFICVKSASGSLYFIRILLMKESAIWFRKLYSLSESNNTRPYFTYLKQYAQNKKQDSYAQNFFDSRVQFILDELSKVSTNTTTTNPTLVTNTNSNSASAAAFASPSPSLLLLKQKKKKLKNTLNDGSSSKTGGGGGEGGGRMVVRSRTSNIDVSDDEDDDDIDNDEACGVNYNEINDINDNASGGGQSVSTNASSQKSGGGSSRSSSLDRLKKAGTTKKKDLISILLTTAIHASSVNQSHVE